MSYLDRACQSFIDLDSTIRFAAIATIDGELIITKYRKNLDPLLKKQETARSVIHSASRVRERRLIEDKVGRAIFSIAYYEKVKRMAMPLGKKGAHVLIVSFDIEADHESIIWNKIVPLVEPYASIDTYPESPTAEPSGQYIDKR